jgi:hypothetical protein
VGAHTHLCLRTPVRDLCRPPPPREHAAPGAEVVAGPEVGRQVTACGQTPRTGPGPKLRKSFCFSVIGESIYLATGWHCRSGTGPL